MQQLKKMMLSRHQRTTLPSPWVALSLSHVENSAAVSKVQLERQQRKVSSISFGFKITCLATILLLTAGSAQGTVTTSFGCHDYTLVGNVGLLTVGKYCAPHLSCHSCMLHCVQPKCVLLCVVESTDHPPHILSVSSTHRMCFFFSQNALMIAPVEAAHRQNGRLRARPW